MQDRTRLAPRRLTGSGPAASVGFLVDWLEDSRYHWEVLRGGMHAAYERGANLLCFVGGALVPPGQKSAMNWVFDLAKARNVDANIVLSGSLGNAVGTDGLADFCARYGSMPTCSIAIPLPNVSSVCIDNESGMRAAVEHLIRVHSLQRIAFVRGPAANDEAELRLRVYREVLAKNEIPYDQALVVSGDFTRPAGRDAMRVLFSDRKLPVSAVQAVVAANDVMALGAIEGLRIQAIRVPEQVAVVGFDDIEESRFELPPLTTVAQPLHDQGRDAVRMVLDQMRTPGPIEQAVRHTELVTRRSCGCLAGALVSRKSSSPPAPGLGFDAALVRRRQHILADMARAARGELGAAGADWDVRLLNAIADQVRGDSSDTFVRAYDDLLRRMVTSGRNPAVCSDVLSALRSRIVRCIGDSKRRMLAEDIFHEARIMTTSAIEGVQVARRIRAWNDARALMQAGAAIVSARTRDELARAVHDHLPRAGVPRCFIIQFQPAKDGAQLGRVVLAERPDARKSDPIMTASYPVTDILRLAVLPGTDEHAFAVFPLEFADGREGLLVLELGTLEGYAYETLRQVFAAALGRIESLSS